MSELSPSPRSVPGNDKPGRRVAAATRQPDPDPAASSISLTPTRSPPGDRNLDDRHERCDHTAQQARTAYRTYADWEFGIHRPQSCWRELCLTTPCLLY